ncbi:hypothetical protein EHI8A_037980 [Entamoeba histolytica HM-1:IMSS-B]|uniref:Leucine-rich repeat containing protein n=3 Tax=Entamoeba histolytica (strain ATCC 30459 / HM-1:IMSS / ABRM) TaxID=294381 RepID=C4M5Y6_ENTH1|nr:hypothetical protein EHI_137070 [Entamoeba histolytica HM-1:IMSS]EAL47204.1 hypothetical protein EHI_137070 [Entamoeba histolytica HM-1:IMSS]EMH72572.1 hypothetical protein EHI8A_037980 [Entamoeba histolytica HM-1:IMSS-B]ENY61593.1 hypothetical protein EHI7A_039120 [Entamoeba histolytica HM-1:IMSS-A]|eukprot:XP_652590.1 hypothetical protein EHI_137070 [Entamoeba histolytica HM-1:IMSS]
MDIPYLMNIALYLKTVKDIYSFLFISKKCKEALSRLKINPFIDEFNDNEYFEKTIHFILITFPSLETISVPYKFFKLFLSSHNFHKRIQINSPTVFDSNLLINLDENYYNKDIYSSISSIKNGFSLFELTLMKSLEKITIENITLLESLILLPHIKEIIIINPINDDIKYFNSTINQMRKSNMNMHILFKIILKNTIHLSLSNYIILLKLQQLCCLEIYDFRDKSIQSFTNDYWLLPSFITLPEITFIHSNYSKLLLKLNQYIKTQPLNINSLIENKELYEILSLLEINNYFILPFNSYQNNSLHFQSNCLNTIHFVGLKKINVQQLPQIITLQITLCSNINITNKYCKYFIIKWSHHCSFNSSNINQVKILQCHDISFINNQIKPIEIEAIKFNNSSLSNLNCSLSCISCYCLTVTNCSLSYLSLSDCVSLIINSNIFTSSSTFVPVSIYNINSSTIYLPESIELNASLSSLLSIICPLTDLIPTELIQSSTNSDNTVHLNINNRELKLIEPLLCPISFDGDISISISHKVNNPLNIIQCSNLKLSSIGYRIKSLIINQVGILTVSNCQIENLKANHIQKLILTNNSQILSSSITKLDHL